MPRGGARPRTGRKVKPEDKRVPMSFMVHPTTKARIRELSEKYDMSQGEVFDKVVAAYKESAKLVLE
jgi:predicted DNA-binding transcriptional regulator